VDLPGIASLGLDSYPEQVGGAQAARCFPHTVTTQLPHPDDSQLPNAPRSLTAEPLAARCVNHSAAVVRNVQGPSQTLHATSKRTNKRRDFNAQDRKRGSKVDKEKEARSAQSRQFEGLEDSLLCIINWGAPKKQTSSNTKKSGLTGDKGQTLDAVMILLDELTRFVISIPNTGSGEKPLQVVEKRTKERIATHLDDRQALVLPRGSLMADETPSGETPCVGHKRDGLCSLHGTSIECRKRRRCYNFTHNVYGTREGLSGD